MLGYPFDDMRTLFEQRHIPLLGGVPETREKFVHIMPLPLERDLQQGLQESGILTQLVQHLKENGFGQYQDNSGLNGLYGENTGNIFLETFQGSDALILEKELESGVLAVVVEPDPETTLFDKVIILSDPTLLQQNGLRRIYPALLHGGVFIPESIQVGKPILEGKDQAEVFLFRKKFSAMPPIWIVSLIGPVMLIFLLNIGKWTIPDG